LMGLPRFVNASWQKIPSPVPCMYLEGAALGHTAVQGNPVIIGEAMMSSPFRSLRVCPLRWALREA